MQVDLTNSDMNTLLTALEYSKKRIEDAEGTPYDVRRENLQRIDLLATKLRKLRSAGSPQDS